MSGISQRELVLFRRAAEDAIHACNRHYGPFIDVVAHPLNMLSLVVMAEQSNKNKLKADKLQKRVDSALQEINGATRWVNEDAIDDPEFIKGGVLRAFARLEQAIKGGES
ncbi:hypothetical protein [Acinetobacter higginsii]|uniref:hypothetical protein n=1 Tax=Acinetobacter higginsii TaxID=70347 RepID=UPI001F4ABCD9|nr:hypothetical protein [Acinetobacter higginsii]MCH7381308.1 hypothetical protein [Acinetobacter higginsii]